MLVLNQYCSKTPSKSFFDSIGHEENNRSEQIFSALPSRAEVGADLEYFRLGQKLACVVVLACAVPGSIVASRHEI